MNYKHTAVHIGLSFCWLMVFASWAFAHPDFVIRNWLLFSTLVTSIYLVVLHQTPMYYNRKLLNRLR